MMTEEERIQFIMAARKSIESALNDMELIVSIMKRQAQIVDRYLGEIYEKMPEAHKLPPDLKPTIRITDIEKEKICRLYKEGWTIYRIGKEMNRADETVKKTLSKAGAL